MGLDLPAETVAYVLHASNELDLNAETVAHVLHAPNGTNLLAGAVTHARSSDRPRRRPEMIQTRTCTLPSSHSRSKRLSDLGR